MATCELQLNPFCCCVRVHLLLKVVPLGGGYRSTLFFRFFFIANFCLFCKKGNSSVLTAQPFLLLCSCLSSFYYTGNPCLLSIFEYGAKIISSSVSTPSTHPHLDHHVFAPPPSAPGGGSVPGHSGRWGGKLYLAGVAARAAAARRKEDCTNVLLAQTNKTQPSTPSNREICYQHRSDEKLQGDVSSATHTAMEGEKIILEKFTPECITNIYPHQRYQRKCLTTCGWKRGSLLGERGKVHVIDMMALNKNEEESTFYILQEFKNRWWIEKKKKR